MSQHGGQNLAENPATGLRRYGSLEEAFQHRSIPLENREFVRKLLASLDITGFEAASSYIKATRGDSNIAIQISSGFSTGFLTESEITNSVGNVQRWPSSRGQGGGVPTWGVSHPTNALREGGEAHSASTERDYGFCETCFQQLPATKVCSNCTE